MNEREQITTGADGGTGSDVYEWLQCVVAALLLCILVFSFFFRLVDVVGHSMVPTLQNGDKVLASCLTRDYKAGDIVVLCKESFKDEALVKRIIAVAGQTVDIDFDAGVVYVDGAALDEPYTYEPTYRALDFTEPVTVPEGCVFVMGDNRNNSQDSRLALIGCVDTRCIIGKVVFRLLPLSAVGAIYGAEG